MELHTRKVKVPPLAPAPAEPAVAGWVAFEAPTAAGSLRVSCHGLVRHAADAAVLLESAATLLDALDDWLGFALAWRWATPSVASAAAAPHARAQWSADAPSSDSSAAPSACRIELPWALLRSVAAPAEPLATQLRWMPAPAVLVLTQMRLDDDELGALEPGGAVLLPASMTPGWQGRLRPCNEPATASAGLPVALPTPWTPEPASAEPAAGNDDSDAEDLCELRLGLPRPMDVRSLAGWQRSEPIETDARASLWHCIGGAGPARQLASGALMPWGDGWAFQIEGIHPA